MIYLEEGRVVGWTRDTGRSSMTRWSVITGHLPRWAGPPGAVSYVARDLHSGEEQVVLPEQVHSTMPREYVYHVGNE